ncbi:TetR/AcrR family transcriptional regulator [Arthrobacter bambusae]|uniref:TetR/AcrR family transcriptional regulator n=1 Tax=Arthrobacter bambusae TaxID=1338426 RepID=UPI0027800CD8|nr:TetR/AcrR family transcriptional regulator [Arthrobacter bambusae]MDQ0029041.1 TetR/AcrR family transcriptional repressor of nem operon [Arthrobacter bambusae]MDQ0098557.1 TetR/AcrR family transcriptional repressor of nem operon [Arthrobacter bambusae]
MGRVSQAQAQENRRRVLDTSSRLFREQGTNVSVSDLMKAVGLTHGGFYKQFASKEALIREATVHAFAEDARLREAALEHSAGRDGAQHTFIDAYLSTEHRDNPAGGCPIAGLGVDIARGHGDDETRRVFAERVQETAAWFDTGADDGIVRFATMLGALVIARATSGFPISEKALTAARKALTERGDPSAR